MPPRRAPRSPISTSATRRPGRPRWRSSTIARWSSGSGRATIDLIINLTTGPGGRFVPGDDDPKVAAPGTTLVRPERRVEHVLALKPEICSLDLNTMWFGSAVVINTPKNARIMAEAIREAGVMPELEVFDSGDLQLAHQLLADGVLARPPLFQVVLGIRNGFPATPETLLYAKSLLPADAMWAAMGIGRMEFPIVAQACLLGGHVRVGLEDNLYLSKGVLAPSNAALVERAVQLVELLGRSVATPAEARAILGLEAALASASGGRGARALGWREAVGRRPRAVSR